MLLGALLITSCITDQETTPEQKAAEQKAAKRKAAEKAIAKATDALSEVEKSVDDWGRIAISDLLLVEDTGQFKVTYDEDPATYVQAARQNVNGAARSSLATTLYLGSALNAQLSSPISAGSAPTSTTNGAADLSLPNQAQQAMNNFTPAQTLAGITPTNDERQAVQKGINDKIAESLLKFMANPKVGTNSQKIIFGVMQVTCQPGKNTRSDYIADVNISLKYATTSSSDMQDDGKLVKKPLNVEYHYKTKGNQPSVVAVLPLVDNQNVQLENSNRKQVELAANLAAIFAAKGMAAQAKILADYVTKQESDINTRTPIPVATSYTDGSTFGFQIYPFFQGVKHPGKSLSGPGEVLHPITFPAVVAILIDSNDIKPQKPNSVPQMIVVTQGSFSFDTGVSSPKTIQSGKGKFHFDQPTNVFLKNIDLYNGTASMVLTNFDENKRHGFGTFIVPSLATKFVVSDIRDAEAFRRRLHDHHTNSDTVESTICKNLASDAVDYVDGLTSEINPETWPAKLVEALNAVKFLPQKPVRFESQQRYDAAINACTYAAHCISDVNAYANAANELAYSLNNFNAINLNSRSKILTTFI